MATTIQVDEKTKSKLEKMKIYKRESYDDVVNRLLHMAQDNETLSKDTIKNIEKGVADIKAGRTYTSDQVRKKLGLK